MIRYLFLHVPKSAGVLVRTAIWRNLPADAKVLVREEVGESLFDDIPTREFARFHLVSGHFGFEQAARIGGDRIFVTMLRDPLERYLSAYHYWRAQPGASPLFALARELDIYSYATNGHPVVRALVDNGLTWQLVGDYLRRETSLYARLTPEKLLDRALANLALFDMVGVQEDMEASLALLSRIGKWRYPGSARERINETPAYDVGQIDLDRLRKALGDRLKLDEALYAHGRELFARQKARLLAPSPAPSARPAAGASQEALAGGA